MAEKNYRTVAVVPEMPRTIDTQQLHVYTPVGSINNYGVFKPDGQQFVITADGKLRVDASKLIQLNEPAATVVEDGGVADVDVNFTEADSTLLRKFSFVFKNIKGATGDKGDAGQDALQSNYTWTAFSQPVIDTVNGTVFSAFNRTPVVGDMFICVYRYLETDLKTILGVYIVNCEVTEVIEDTSTCKFKITKFLQIPTNYIKEITGPVTSGLEDTYTIVFSDGTTHDFVVTNGATGAQGPAGATGAQGEQGPKGDDGVSITSVTQTGIDGGTRVTITLSDGQTTSFDVMNGINTNFQVVDVLPTTNISTSTIYLVPSTTPGEENIYDEYIYVNGNWEHIGSTSVDLSDYVTKTYFNQNVGDATKNYVVAQMSKIQNLYIEMYESGSVPEKGQALTLTNSNFARVPAQGQYFALIELVNTKDKYYSICKIASVDTTTCSATVEAVTELDNGTEIEAIKQSIAALTATVEGKADASDLAGKLDKVTTADTYRRVYVIRADGAQGTLPSTSGAIPSSIIERDATGRAKVVDGEDDSDIATVAQVNAAGIQVVDAEYDGTNITVTEAQRTILFSDNNVILHYNTGKSDVYLLRKSKDLGRVTFEETSTTSANVAILYTYSLTSASLTFTQKITNVEKTANKVTSLSDSSTDVQYPSAKAVVDYVAANAGTAYHVELTSPSGTLTKDQVDKLVADTDSYILYTTDGFTYKLCHNTKNANALTYSVVVYEQEYRVMITLATYEWQYSKVELQNVADRTSMIGTGDTIKYPNTKAVYDADQATLTAAKSYADTAIANAITTALNTPV